MTERLYYTDSYGREFDATLLALVEHEGRPAALLDRTAFYPTSGGQLHDTGLLGGAHVVDVVAAPDGSVLHLLAEPLPSELVGAALHGEIYWPRRYDHMQQHSGQHLLSQVFHRRFGMETVSVHFGSDDSTLDLEIAEVSEEQLAEAEAQANDEVFAARPITAYFVEQDELGRVPLRRPPAVSGQVRIVEIAGFDWSACGGTHVRSTAEIGPVKLLRSERRKGKVRVYFLCGKRAVADYAAKHRLLAAVAASFSTDIAQTPDLVARAVEQNKALQRRVEELARVLLAHELDTLLDQAQHIRGRRIITQLFTGGRTLDEVKLLAGLAQEQERTIALFAHLDGGKLTALFARSADLDAHMGQTLRAALQAFGGAGGGRPEFAQGGSVPAERAHELLAFAVQRLQESSAG